MLASFPPHLFHIRQRLHQLNTGQYAPADERELLTLLSATIRVLHQLYPDHLYEQPHAHLQELVLLQQRHRAPSTASLEASAEWSSLHNVLLTTVESTLADPQLQA